MDEKVRQAIQLIQAGQRDGGRVLLKEALQANPYDETTWMWMVEALDTPTARRRALEACLRYLPDCQPAQQGLARLQATVYVPPDDRPRITPTTPTPSAQTRRFPLAAILLIVFSFCVAGAAITGYVLLPRGPDGAGSTQSLDPSAEPIQRNLYNAERFNIADDGFVWEVTPRASYRVTARVLGKRNYAYDPFDKRSKLSPYDLALGWGAMSDPQVDQWITWSQRNRWYYYEWVGSSPYKERDIGLHSANTHIIPANNNINAVLSRVQINDLIYLEGYLVYVMAEINGKKWVVDTSLTRTDTGDGGCEQLYVERIIWNGQEYR